MPFVFVLARDWTLRTAVRAELRERGIDALGMDSADDAGRAIAARQFPSAVVVEGIPEFASNPAIQNLIARVPTVWIASRTEKIPEAPPSSASADAQQEPAGSGRLRRRLTGMHPIGTSASWYIAPFASAKSFLPFSTCCTKAKPLDVKFARPRAPFGVRKRELPLSFVEDLPASAC